MRDHAICAFSAIRVLLAPGLATELLQFFDAHRRVVDGAVLAEVELLLWCARHIGLRLEGLLRAVVARAPVIRADKLLAVCLEQRHTPVADGLRLLAAVAKLQLVLAGAMRLQRVVDALEAVVAVGGVGAAILAVGLEIREALIDDRLRLGIAPGVAKRELFFEGAPVCLRVLL